jgi:hypoxanthine phosphoribosyltransferase
MDRVINGKIRDELQKLGLTQHLKIIKNPAVTGTPTNSSLAAQISHATVHGTDIRNNLKNQLKLEQSYRKLATDLLKDEALVFSPKTLAELSAAQHKRILQAAKSKGISADNIYYLVPHAEKSYGMVTMIHQMVNNVPSGQIVTSASEIPPQALAKSMVVLLDDVAGSGNSLSAAVNSLKGSSSYGYSSYATAYNGPVLVAPMVSYETADQLFATKTGITYQPAKKVKSILNSPAFKNMDPIEKSKAYTAIGSTGYASTGGVLAFPYMAPDNNTTLAKKAFAPLITLNGQGVK